jgi:hypothetical protein
MVGPLYEIWLKHPKWNVLVSNRGQICFGWKEGNPLKKLTQRSDGYLVTSVGLGGKGQERVHILVMETFEGPCPVGMDIRHLDGNKSNNDYGNLKYGTRVEQIQDQKDHGTFSPPPILTGFNNPHYKYDDKTKTDVIELNEFGYPYRLIHQITGVSKTHIGRIIKEVRLNV